MRGFVASLFAALGAACQPAPQPGTVVVAVDAPVKDLDPRLAVDGPSARLSRLVFRGLTQVDDHGNPALDLAAEVTLVTPLLARVRVRGDARFHDSRPVTAADVAYTYTSVMEPAFGTPIAGEFRKRFAAVLADPHDPLVAHLHLRRPLATLWTDLVLGIAPAHLLRDRPRGRFVGPVVGSAPWRVVGPDRGDRVAVERLDPVAGGPRRLEFVAIADEGSRALSVLGGGADVAWGGLSPAILRGALHAGTAHIARGDGIALTYLGLNLRLPPLHDARVRHALALAIDRPTLLATTQGGRGLLADGLFAPGHWARTQLPQTPFDPQRAAHLLDEAGLRPGPDGVRMRLEIKVSTSRPRRQLARALADQWRAVGVDAHVRPLELATFLGDVRAGRFEVFVLQLPEPFEPDQLTWMLHTDNAAVKFPVPDSPSPFARLDRRGVSVSAWDESVALAEPACAHWQRTRRAEGLRAFALSAIGSLGAAGGANRTGYAHPAVDCWLDLGGSELNRDRRAAWYAKAQRQIAQDRPIVPLWWEDATALLAADLAIDTMPADGRYAALAGLRRITPRSPHPPP
ncbi:MAG: ABC transporter substrate-binding protein [Deltaproteobacteria bacterium]|nr:ABC transporter substrate-binding protein [Deltaproteobacteria bacterium]